MKILTKRNVLNVLQNYSDDDIIGVPVEETSCPFATIVHDIRPELMQVRVNYIALVYYNPTKDRYETQKHYPWVVKTIQKIDDVFWSQDGITVREFKQFLSSVLGKRIV